MKYKNRKTGEIVEAYQWGSANIVPLYDTCSTYLGFSFNPGNVNVPIFILDLLDPKKRKDQSRISFDFHNFMASKEHSTDCFWEFNYRHGCYGTIRHGYWLLNPEDCKGNYYCKIITDACFSSNYEAITTDSESINDEKEYRELKEENASLKEKIDFDKNEADERLRNVINDRLRKIEELEKALILIEKDRGSAEETYEVCSKSYDKLQDKYIRLHDENKEMKLENIRLRDSLRFEERANDVKMRQFTSRFDSVVLKLDLIYRACHVATVEAHPVPAFIESGRILEIIRGK